jgi:hypothetical protein
MIPIGQMPFGEVISSVRDVVVVFTVLTFGWKVRSWVQPAIDFFDNANQFMADTRKDMQTLLNNHLSHIESDLRHMSGRSHEHVDSLADTSEGDDAIR